MYDACSPCYGYAYVPDANARSASNTARRRAGVTIDFCAHRADWLPTCGWRWPAVRMCWTTGLDCWLQ